MGKNHIAILFNTNIDLINDWRFEKSFSLHFYSGLLKQERERKIFIGKLDDFREKEILEPKDHENNLVFRYSKQSVGNCIE